MDALQEDKEDVVVPYTQGGFLPQRLLITLLGDYWYDHEEHIPSAALVQLLAEFGISDAGTRAALSRLARRGLLVSSKSGRRTFYGLSERATALLREGARHILGFAAQEREWDGTWTVVAFSVPEKQRNVRHVLRTRLRWLGFASLYDGLWVSPRASAEAIGAELDELQIEAATVMVGTIAARDSRNGNPIAAWDLRRLRKVYEEFIAAFRPLRERTRAGQVSAAEALRARTEIMDAWRNMPNLDPELPLELLPPSWPRRRARELFVEIYDSLGPLAEMRIRQIFARHAPGLARLARHHASDFAG
jgi:phenylacetic acid degradation operon negative regulatory protein